MRRGFAAGGKALESPAVHDKDIEPSVVVVVVERDATASGFEQILVLVFSAEDGFDIQTGFVRDVAETDAEIGGRRRGFLLTDLLAGCVGSTQPKGTSHFKDAVEG